MCIALSRQLSNTKLIWNRDSKFLHSKLLGPWLTTIVCQSTTTMYSSSRKVHQKGAPDDVENTTLFVEKWAQFSCLFFFSSRHTAMESKALWRQGDKLIYRYALSHSWVSCFLFNNISISICSSAGVKFCNLDQQTGSSGLLSVTDVGD